MTNKGLRIELPLIKICDFDQNEQFRAQFNPRQKYRNYVSKGGHDPLSIEIDEQNAYLAVLNCYCDDSFETSPPLFIYLQKLGSPVHQGALGVLDSYVRIFSSVIESIDVGTKWASEITEVYIKEPDYYRYYSQVPEYQSPGPFCIKKIATGASSFAVVDVYPHRLWSGTGVGRQLDCCRRPSSGALVFRNNAGEGFLVILAVDILYNGQTYCKVMTNKDKNNMDWRFPESTIGDLLYKVADRVKRAGGKQHLDRVHTSLPGGFVVTVALRPGRVLGERNTLVEIIIKAETPQNHAQPSIAMQKSLDSPSHQQQTLAGTYTNQGTNNNGLLRYSESEQSSEGSDWLEDAIRSVRNEQLRKQDRTARGHWL
ncbi:hypothetical protein MMC11_003966 [Xylographa trunciseda]|nr:hypothetical protein [Xylographa trunciseda]